MPPLREPLPGEPPLGVEEGFEIQVSHARTCDEAHLDVGAGGMETATRVGHLMREHHGRMIEGNEINRCAGSVLARTSQARRKEPVEAVPVRERAQKTTVVDEIARGERPRGRRFFDREIEMAR